MERTPAPESPPLPGSIWALLSDDGAVGHYRLLFPLTFLAQAGVRCQAALTLPSWEELAAADLILAQRQHSPEAVRLLRRAVDRGKTVIYEIDDWLHGIPEDNPARALFPPGSVALQGIIELLRHASGVTVSTPELAEIYRPLNPNLAVLPNRLDLGIRNWSTPPPDRDRSRPVLGWAGGATHVGDLPLIQEPIRRLLRRYPEIRFGLMSTPGLARWVEESWGIDNGRLLLIPYQPFRDYPQALARFDIGLAPLRSHRFNCAKSDLKVLEYGAWGLPVVASAVAPYQRTLEEGRTGFLAASAEEWEEKLARLIESPALRDEIGAALAAQVREQFDIGRDWPRWPAAWHDLAAAASGSPAPVPEPTRSEPCPCGSGRKFKQCCLKR